MEAKSWVGHVEADLGEWLDGRVRSVVSQPVETEAMARQWIAAVLAQNPNVDLSYWVTPSLEEPVFTEEG